MSDIEIFNGARESFRKKRLDESLRSALLESCEHKARRPARSATPPEAEVDQSELTPPWMQRCSSDLFGDQFMSRSDCIELPPVSDSGVMAVPLSETYSDQLQVDGHASFLHDSQKLGIPVPSVQEQGVKIAALEAQHALDQAALQEARSDLASFRQKEEERMDQNYVMKLELRVAETIKEQDVCEKHIQVLQRKKSRLRAKLQDEKLKLNSVILETCCRRTFQHHWCHSREPEMKPTLFKEL